MATTRVIVHITEVLILEAGLVEKRFVIADNVPSRCRAKNTRNFVDNEDR